VLLVVWGIIKKSLAGSRSIYCASFELGEIPKAEKSLSEQHCMTTIHERRLQTRILTPVGFYESGENFFHFASQ
jgi:hypothetical protein